MKFSTEVILMGMSTLEIAKVFVLSYWSHPGFKNNVIYYYLTGTCAWTFFFLKLLEFLYTFCFLLTAVSEGRHYDIGHCTNSGV